MILILQGLPASGKSTWAKEKCKNPNWVRVNKDDIRAMLGVEYSKKTEALVVSVERGMVSTADANGFNVIVDSTNLNPIHEEYYRLLYPDVEVRRFSTPLEECIERDSKRGNSVGEQVIKQMYDRWKSQNPWL